MKIWLLAGMLLCGCAGAPKDAITVKTINLQKADGSVVTLTAEDLEAIKKGGEAVNRLSKMAESAQHEGSLTQCKANLKNLATALEMSASDNRGDYPATLEDLVPGKYLLRVPSCPTGGNYGYEVSSEPDNFTMTCTGDHSGTTAPKGFPQYFGDAGMVEKP